MESHSFTGYFALGRMHGGSEMMTKRFSQSFAATDAVQQNPGNLRRTWWKGISTYRAQRSVCGKHGQPR